MKSDPFCGSFTFAFDLLQHILIHLFQLCPSCLLTRENMGIWMGARQVHFRLQRRLSVSLIILILNQQRNPVNSGSNVAGNLHPPTFGPSLPNLPTPAWRSLVVRACLISAQKPPLSSQKAPWEKGQDHNIFMACQQVEASKDTEN